MLWGFKPVIEAAVKKGLLNMALQNDEYNTFKFIIEFYFLYSLNKPSREFLQAYRIIFIVPAPNIAIVFPVPCPVRNHGTTRKS